MTTHPHGPLGPDQQPDLWPPPGEPEPDYRQLEQAYRLSAEYAAMVRRYPLLQQMIHACHRDDLVADTRHQPRLAWDRSHGEN